MIGLVRRAATALCVTTLCGMTGCDGFWVSTDSSSSGSGSTSGDYVYVANTYPNATTATYTLTAYSVGTGTLTAVANSSETLGLSPQALVVTPTNSFLYVACSSNIYRYTIGSGGLLSGGTLLSYATVKAMAISPNGDWLLALDASTTTPTIDVFSITTSTGALVAKTPVAYSNSDAGTAAVTGTIDPSDIKISPKGDFVVAALGRAGDVFFTFNSAVGSGTLTSSGLITEPNPINYTKDNALAISSDSKYVYIARSGDSSGLAVYSISSGKPTALSGSPFAAGTAPHSVVLNNSYAYVGNQGNSSVSPTISEYSVASDGTVTELGTSPYTTASAPWALTVDKSGDYLLAISYAGSPDLTMYSFDSTTTGKLDYVTSLMTGTTDPTGPVAITTTH